MVNGPTNPHVGEFGATHVELKGRNPRRSLEPLVGYFDSRNATKPLCVEQGNLIVERHMRRAGLHRIGSRRTIASENSELNLIKIGQPLPPVVRIALQESILSATVLHQNEWSRPDRREVRRIAADILPFIKMARNGSSEIGHRGREQIKRHRLRKPEDGRVIVGRINRFEAGK